jgi:hypothetical protein
MQNENLSAKKGSLPTIDLETKKEVAKIGMAVSLAVVTATSIYMKNRVMKNLHIGAGFALIGFSVWHHTLYQPGKATKAPLPKRPKPKTLALGHVYTEVILKEKVTKRDVRLLKESLGNLCKESGTQTVHVLIDAQLIQERAIWEAFVALLSEDERIAKIAIFGNDALPSGEFLSKTVRFFDTYLDAKTWAS